jgi:hypothetical protein
VNINTPEHIAMATPTPTSEETWCAAQATEAKHCAQRLELAHGRIGVWPAWHAMPTVSLWAVESANRPEWVGWWVMCCAMHSDAVAAHHLATPADALRAFAKRWTAHSLSLDRGEVPPTWAHVEVSTLPKLAAELKSWSAQLGVWANAVQPPELAQGQKTLRDGLEKLRSQLGVAGVIKP